MEVEGNIAAGRFANVEPTAKKTEILMTGAKPAFRILATIV
jgi:hypothetical protein